MTEFHIETRATIWGTHDAWSLARSTVTPEATTNIRVLLTIQGDIRNGYHLVQSPEGFFTADSWHSTLVEAFEYARELFGVTREDWHE